MIEENYDRCFVCGQANPIGLKIDFSYDEEGAAYATLALDQVFEGYPGVVHGGILSTLLDEVMAKAVINSGKIAVTAKLSVSYRKALNSGQSVLIKGWITRAKSRTISTAASISDESGIYAEAEAVFVVPRQDL
ncbi:MAG: PaaI family thioesterase [Candidatus Cloacimonetes bacterium]|jgi:uncharacterized protein (TIGR00369 family)|nr:PaaI family thioesterase [Candidatus Cloacimonadota bacterium]MCB5287602.1 PaaI family thioesterase [Candidatus Cloacimonadota bacterium]MCK9184561.1 PaaI family thioesterase [Candidatus Cloacimonadota bacterium]MCK9584760.1 PaaI family thioesterase [Candidatus Cloacimonadota bacterium]MDY0229924.1 PaaI family thioesterase [Candidatus Cloacimonadaceae bacterium]